MTIITVRTGDSVYKLAKQHGVTPDAIVRLNGLQAPERLVVGEALLLPSNTSPYTVRIHDSLHTISQRYGVPIGTLLALNPSIKNPHQIFVGQSLRLPAGARTPAADLILNGYSYPTVKYETLAQSLPHLNFLSIFSSHVDANGQITPMSNDQNAIAQAKKAGVRPHLVIANLKEPGGFDSATVQAFLQNPAAEQRFFRELIPLMHEKGYTGVDVDFEYVPAAVRENLSDFLAKARAWLHEEGFLLTSAVPPLVKDDQTGLLFEGFDLEAEGKYNDYVTLMTYEWGYQSGPPMAVAPLPEVRRTLEYAVTRIPPKKILLGIPGYGYDWKIPWQQGTNATVIQNGSGAKLAAEKHTEIQYSETSQAPHFRYIENGQEHEVWFDDARSLHAKIQLAQEFGLGGLSYWTVNHPFPQNWSLVRALLRS